MPSSTPAPWEAGIFRVEENGSESCDLSTNSSFVLVRVPLRTQGADEKDQAAFHYSIGSFCGRDTPLALGEDEPIILRFRIPLELFRAGECFAVEVLARTPATQRGSSGPSVDGRLAGEGPRPGTVG